MASANILDTVVEGFLSAIEDERKLPSGVVEELKRLAYEGELNEKEKVEAALRGEPQTDDQAKDS